MHLLVYFPDMTKCTTAFLNSPLYKEQQVQNILINDSQKAENDDFVKLIKARHKNYEDLL